MNPSCQAGSRAERARDVAWIFSLILIAGMAVPSLADGSDNDGSTASRTPGNRGPTGVADIKYKGTPTVGSRISVGLDTPVAAGTTCLWTQVEGPAVVLDDRSKPSINFIVPSGAEKLGFLLTLSDLSGEKTIRFDIPIQPSTETATTPGLIADAGDDLVGLVGHRTILNGSHRGDGEKVAYRWIQLGGPKVERSNQDRTYYTFTPALPGIYRFALIAASNSDGSAPMISEPDEVVVTVGSPPGSETSAGYTPPAVEQATRAARALASAEGLEQLAVTFEAISERSGMYKAFGEMSSEMMRGSTR